MSDGTAPPSTHPRPHAGPVLLPLRIGAAADLPRVQAAAADRAGAVQRSNRAGAEAAALRALMPDPRPG